MIDEADHQFTTWAGKQIIVWESDDRLTPFKKFTHIIGDEDVLYLKKIKNAQVIKKATHLMMLEKVDEMNFIIFNHIADSRNSIVEASCIEI